MATTPATVLGNYTHIVDWTNPPCSAILRRDVLDGDLATALEGNRALLSLVKQLSHRNLLNCFNVQCSASSGLMIWMEKACFPSLANLLDGETNKDLPTKNSVGTRSFADDIDDLSATEEMNQAERELLALINDTTIEDLSEEHVCPPLPGPSASTHLSIAKPPTYDFTEEEVWTILAQLVSVLSYLHSSIKTGISSEGTVTINHGRLRLDTVFYDPVTRVIKVVPPHLPSNDSSSSALARDIYSIYTISLHLCGIGTCDVQPLESKEYQADLSTLNHRRFSPDLKQFILTLRSLCLHDKPVVSTLLLFKSINDALLPFTHLEFQEQEQATASVQTRTPLEIYRHLKDAASLPNIKRVTDPIAAERVATSQSARSIVQEHADNISELLTVSDNSIFAEYTSVVSAGNTTYPRVASVFRDPSMRETGRLDSSVDLGMSVLCLSSASAGNTMLHRAVLDRDLAAVGRNLGYAKRFNQDGHTALMLCAIENWIEGANILVFHESGLFTKKGHTALYYALELGHHDIARILTDTEGVSTKEPYVDNLNQTDLMRAAIAGDIVAVWSWLPRQHKWQDIYGRTALIYAVESRVSLAIIKLLVPMEAGIEDFSGKTALHHAVEVGSIDVVRLLLNSEKGKSYSSKGLETNYVLSLRVFASELAYLHRKTEIFEAVFAAERPIILRELHITEDSDDTIDGIVDKEYQRLIAAVENYLEFEVFLRVSELENIRRGGYTALMHAAASKYFAIQKGVKRDTYQEYALCNIVKLLLGEVGQHFSAPREALPDSTLISRAGTSIIDPFVPGATALIIAAICDDTIVIPILLDHEKGLRDDIQRTALMWAAKYNNIAAAKLLAPHEKALTNGRPYCTALYVAIEHGSEATAKILTPYEGYPDADLASRVQGRHTELMRAAENGDLPGVWSYRFQLGLQNESGYTALMYACIFGDINCILQLRHEENLVAKDGTTARALLEQHWRETNPQIVDMIDVVEVLDDKGRNQLERAIQQRDPELIIRFLHLQDRTREVDGLTVLMQIVELGFTEIVEIVVREYPAQLGRTTRSYLATKVLWEDVTALMIAASHGYDGAVATLAETTEARMRESGKGRTALMAASINGHFSTASLLVDKEARMQNNEGWTALMYAAAYNLDEVIRVLMPAEAQVQMKDGWSALMTAAKNGHLQAVSLLLPYEAGMLKKAKYPALYYAAAHGHTDIVSLLLSEEREERYAYFVLEALSKRRPETAVINLESAISLLQSHMLKKQTLENAAKEDSTSKKLSKVRL